MNLKELLETTKEPQKQVEDFLESYKFFHPEDTSVFKHIERQKDKHEALDVLRKMSLPKMIKEFLDGTSGGERGDYLIPDKIYDTLYTSAAKFDICPLASPVVTCPGSSLKVSIEVDGSFVAKKFSSGGKIPDDVMDFTQATATPVSFGIHPAITNDLIEDSQFDMIPIHLGRAAEQVAQYATEIWLADLITCSDGDGTQNTATSDAANVTDLDDLVEAYVENLMDKFISDVIIMGPGPIRDIISDASVSNYSDQFHSKWAMGAPPVTSMNPMYFANFLGCPIYVIPQDTSYTGTGSLYISSKWHSFVLNKANAMLTVRKRWLKIENYSDPVRDLVGAVISSRQDQVSVYNDASAEITEG